MTSDRTILHLVKNNYGVHTIKPHHSLSFFIAELTQVFKRLGTLNDTLAVALAAGMFNKTHNIVSIEG
jgi:hypothetical protein